MTGLEHCETNVPSYKMNWTFDQIYIDYLLNRFFASFLITFSSDKGPVATGLA